MTRIQLYIDDEQYKEVQLMALMGYGNPSQIMRQSLSNTIKKTKKNKTMKKFDPIKDFGSLLKGGDKDLSSKIDYYLYEEPYEK